MHHTAIHSLLSLVLLLGAAGCGSGDSSRVDAGSAAPDGGGVEDGGGSGGEDAGAVVDAGVDAGPRGDAGASAQACEEFNTPLGRSLTVHFGDEVIDFSTGAFDADYNEDVVYNEYYWYFIFKSADGAYGLELRIPPLEALVCPSSYDLSQTNDSILLIFYDARTFTALAESDAAGSSGTLTLDAYVTTYELAEVELHCTDCVLGPSPGATKTVRVDGSLHGRR